MNMNDFSNIKSVGNSNTTSRDLFNITEVKSLIFVLAESVSARLRQSGLLCSGIQISIRDKNLLYYTAQHKNDYLFSSSKIIADTAILIFNSSYDLSVPIRSIGVKAFGLYDEKFLQLNIFNDYYKQKKFNDADIAIDKIRNKYGFKAIKRGVVFADYEMKNMNPVADNTIHPLNYFKDKII
jgi:DNA polymerase-4